MRGSVMAILAIGVILVLSVGWLGSGFYSRIPNSPEAALKSFYESDVAEDQLMDPLILAGADVIPLLASELLNPDMPRKRYAIGALGNIGDRSALPILERITQAGSEPEYVRCDALSAIGMIDQAAADQLLRPASDLKHECEAWLESEPSRRGFFKALLGWHE